MHDKIILIDDILLIPGEKSFIKTIQLNNRAEQIYITPLLHGQRAEWFQVIFESGDKRYIQPGRLWGWCFLDQVPEPEDEESQEAEDDLALAEKVGLAIEAYYHIE